MSFAGVGRVVLAAAVVAALAPERASAVVYCSDSEDVPVGEMRYRAVSGTDESYANAYADTGAELTLPAGYPVGCYDDGNSFISYAYMEDTSSDCSATTFEMKLDWSSTQSGNCPSGYSTTTRTYVVDRCSDPYSSSDIVYAGSRLVATPTNDYYRWWRGTLTVSGAESEVSDVGCWEVLP